LQNALTQLTLAEQRLFHRPSWRISMVFCRTIHNFTDRTKQVHESIPATPPGMSIRDFVRLVFRGTSDDQGKLGPPMASTLPEELYEVHATIELNGHAPDTLAGFANTNGYRFLHIQLAAGSHASQPMLSWRQSGGTDAILNRVASVSSELEFLAMKVVRTKIEVHFETLVPDGTPRYFEAHFKVAFEEGQETRLEQLARELGIHLSRNARSNSGNRDGNRKGNRVERFLTAREPSLVTARDTFARVEQELRREGWHLVEVQQEAVLYDSNLDLDKGWML
jgi:hypothetical protein